MSAVQIAVTIAKSVIDTYGWKLNLFPTVADFATWLNDPYHCRETMAQIDAMTREQRNKIKAQAQAFVMGTLTTKQRTAATISKRSALTYDFDHCVSWDAVGELWRRIEDNGWRAIIYPTFSSREDAPRVRVIVLLSRNVSIDEFAYLTRAVAELTQTEGVEIDEGSHQPERAMYAPIVAADQSFWIKSTDGEPFDVDKFLDARTDWQQTEWVKPQQEPVNSYTNDEEWPYRWMGEEYPDGTRTEALKGALGVLFSHGIPSKLTWQFIQGFNQLFDPPLEQEKLIHTFKSYARRELRKWPR